MHENRRPQIRVAVSLIADQDAALMAELERWHHGRRSGRLRELARLGAQAQTLEEQGTQQYLYQMPPVKPVSRQEWRLQLRIADEGIGSLYDRVVSATNRSDQLRIFAFKGLQREAALSGTPPLTPAADNRTGTGIFESQATQALRAMLGSLSGGSK